MCVSDLYDFQAVKSEQLSESGDPEHDNTCENRVVWNVYAWGWL